MGKQHDKPEAHETATEPTVTIPASAMGELIASKVRDEVARLMTAKGPDERIREAIERQRGIGLPTAAEFLIPCKSPLTGSTFTARTIVSRTLGTRVVEMLDYCRPEGWDRKKADGGIVEDGDQMPLQESDGKPGKRYVKWLYEAFFLRDANEYGGKVLPDYLRLDHVQASGSVTLTPAQMEQLGINAEQIKAALAEPDATAAE